MASDYFLQIDGILGDSQTAGFVNTIPIESFSWGVTQAGISSLSGSTKASKASVREMSFTSVIGSQSPKLFLACASGTRLKNAVLTGRKPGATPFIYAIYTLGNVVVTSYEESANEDVPMDSYTLSFSRMAFKYIHQNAGGSPDPNKTFETNWDLATNTGGGFTFP